MTQMLLGWKLKPKELMMENDVKLHEMLHETMNADVWAKEFMRIWGTRLPEIDLDLMRAWFANSIMCGHDHAYRRSQPVIDKLKSLMMLTDPAVSNQEMNPLSMKQFEAFERWEQTRS